MVPHPLKLKRDEQYLQSSIALLITVVPIVVIVRYGWHGYAVLYLIALIIFAIYKFVRGMMIKVPKS